MLKWTSCFLFLAIVIGTAQGQDFISLKKRNGITLKSFYAGSPISFTAPDGRLYEGPIEKIQHDSIYIKTYQVNLLKSIWNTPLYDTVNSFIVPFHYKSIKIVFKNIQGMSVSNVFVRNRFFYWAAKRLWIGAAGYVALNLINSLINGQRLTEAKNMRNLGIAIAAFGVGYYFEVKSDPRKISTKKYRLVYVNMQ